MGTPRVCDPDAGANRRAQVTRLIAVYTQPDRPKGRGQQIAMSPVKEAALRLGLPVAATGADPAAGSGGRTAADAADVMVVVGYGQIIPQAIIDLPRHGIINVHASLLPKYRGAAPIQWAIANGETVTGVTTMRIDAGLDTGDMLLMAETPVRDRKRLRSTLGRDWPSMGADLLLETLRRNRVRDTRRRARRMMRTRRSRRF